MASPTALLPILLLLTISNLSLSVPDQPGTPKQDILSLTSESSTLPTWPATESSIPTSTLLSEPSSYFNNLASAQVPALITGLREGAADSSLLQEAGLVERSLKPTVTVAKSTRTTVMTRISNGTGASTGMPSNKSANRTGMMMSSSSAVMRGGNATVLPPEPVFTSAGPKSEAGREVGRGMGTGMGILVVVGLWVWGGMVLM